MLFLLACSGPMTNAFLLEDQEYTNALPQREQHRIPLSRGDSTTSEIEALADDFNQTFDGLLGWVDGVRAIPPTERGENSRVWGPHIADDTGDLYWRVSIERTEPGRFAWEFEVRQGADGDWLSFFGGNYLAGFDASESQGSFTYDGDMLVAIDASDDGGTMTVEYDYIGEHELYAQLAQDGGAGEYWYREEDGVSSAWFDIPSDVYSPDEDATSSALEDYAIAAQWLESGAGRQESRSAGGDLGELVVLYTECWDAVGEIVYAHYECAICTEPAAGDAADCVFAEGLDPTDPPD